MPLTQPPALDVLGSLGLRRVHASGNNVGFTLSGYDSYRTLGVLQCTKPGIFGKTEFPSRIHNLDLAQLVLADPKVTVEKSCMTLKWR